MTWANAAFSRSTGYTLEEGRLLPYAAKSFLPLVIARSLVAGLPMATGSQPSVRHDDGWSSTASTSRPSAC